MGPHDAMLSPLHIKPFAADPGIELLRRSGQGMRVEQARSNKCDDSGPRYADHDGSLTRAIHGNGLVAWLLQVVRLLEHSDPPRDLAVGPTGPRLVRHALKQKSQVNGINR